MIIINYNIIIINQELEYEFGFINVWSAKTF